MNSLPRTCPALQSQPKNLLAHLADQQKIFYLHGEFDAGNEATFF